MRAHPLRRRPGGRAEPAARPLVEFFFARESERGLNPFDDYLYALDARLALAPGDRAGIVVGLEPGEYAAPAIVDAARARGASFAAGEPDALRAQLALAADGSSSPPRPAARRAARSSRATRGSAIGAAIR